MFSSDRSSAKIWIYHELQESQLCGQHCLNNLLQGPHFTAPDLAAIAHEMDDEERKHMMEAGSNTADVLRYMSEGSGNVDDSGNFSLQVLNTALQRSHDISLVSWSSSEASKAVQDPTTQSGFIVNRSNHWFAIRKINSIWWNLNSTEERPVHITDFFLTAFLSQLRADNYLVFIAVGSLPTYGTEMGPEIGGTGQWYEEAMLLADTVSEAQTAVPKFSGVGHRLGGGASERETERERERGTGGLGEGPDDVDEELQAAIRLSMQESAASASPSQTCSSSSSSWTPALSKKEEMRARRLAAAEKRSREEQKQI